MAQDHYKYLKYKQKYLDLKDSLVGGHPPKVQQSARKGRGDNSSDEIGLTRENESLFHSILTDKCTTDEYKITELDRLYAENHEILQITQKRGNITLILRYGILKKSQPIIDSVAERITMTRDFLELMKYYNNPETNRQIFLEKVNYDLLLPKDIQYMLENNLEYLISLLHGRFLPLPGGPGSSNIDRLETLFIPNPQYYIDRICQDVKDKPALHRILSELDDDSKSYDVIIDGGNVMHSYKGTPDANHIKRSVEIMRQQGRKPLVILFSNHMQNRAGPIYRIMTDPLNGINYILTPPCHYDDIFILIAFLKNSQKSRRCHILSNDHYGDSIEKYKSDNRMEVSNLANFITDSLIPYETKSNGAIVLMSQILHYSRCIQTLITRAETKLVHPLDGVCRILHNAQVECERSGSTELSEPYHQFLTECNQTLERLASECSRLPIIELTVEPKIEVYMPYQNGGFRTIELP